MIQLKKGEIKDNFLKEYKELCLKYGVYITGCLDTCESFYLNKLNKRTTKFLDELIEEISKNDIYDGWPE